MARVLAGALILAGAIGMTTAVHKHNTRFSPSNVFARQRMEIERAYLKDSRGPKSKEERAKASRKLRYKELREGIDSHKDSSDEEMCKFELLFSGKLKGKTKEDLANESFEPFDKCTSSTQLSYTASRWYSWGGMISLLMGAYLMIRSFGRRRSSRDSLPHIETKPFSGLSNESVTRLEEIAEERKSTLEEYGFTSDLADAITAASTHSISVEAVRSPTHTAADTIRTFEVCGFTTAGITDILLKYPHVLNLSPQQIVARLLMLENDGYQAEEIRQAVRAQPSILGVEINMPEQSGPSETADES